MTIKYNQQLKQLFRSNTIVNIKLGISLALSQGYSWNYIAEKCLEEWLLFSRYSEYDWGNSDKSHEIIYAFTPNECIDRNRPGVCWYSIIMNKNMYESRAQRYIEDSFVRHFEITIKSESLELIKQPIINRMEEFLKLIYNNEHSNM